MSNSKAFVRFIGPNGSGEGEDASAHQSSPAWVLTFVRWEQRDTLRTGKTQTLSGITNKIENIDYSSVKKPLVVENDCVQVSTTMNKGTLTPSMNAVLVQTDVNYATEIAPGDFVFVNMLNWEKDARRVASQARNLEPINGINDGFKGIFKVQGVRKVLSIDPATGTKVLIFKINGFAFTEFNNTIYFNPYMIDPNSEVNNLLLFMSNIGNDWALLASQKGLTNVQDIMKFLIESFIGDGISDKGRMDKLGNVKSPNVHFFMPKAVGNLLGVSGVKAAKDIYNYLFGIQQYSGSASSIASGMNPIGLSQIAGRFFYTNAHCQGDVINKPEYWNQVKTWSILNQFVNSPLNELYTCFKVSTSGKILPTLVFRQIAFTTEDFNAGNVSVTRFMNLPRWKISPAIVTDMDIGRDEAARINFVQYFGKSSLGKDGASISQEIAEHNYLYDIDDVKRSGLRPYIINTQFDESIPEGKSSFRAVLWARIIGDSLIGGHLKLNGTLTCVGIVDPIAVGDNLEFDGIVYHIEQIVHTATIAGMDGKKTFRTSINLSSGLSKDSGSAGTKYAEMTYGDSYQLRDVDYNNNKLLPGVSESQDVIYRPNSLDEPNSGGAKFPQPDIGTSIHKSVRGEKDKK